MSQIHTELDNVRKRTKELVDQIEKYKASKELIQTSADAMDSMCEALGFLCKEIKNAAVNMESLTGGEFKEMQKSVDGLQHSIIGTSKDLRDELNKKISSLDRTVTDKINSNTKSMTNMKSELHHKIQSSGNTVVEKINSNEKSITSLSAEFNRKIEVVSTLFNKIATNHRGWLVLSVFMQLVIFALLVVVLYKV